MDLCCVTSLCVKLMLVLQVVTIDSGEMKLICGGEKKMYKDG